MFIKSQNPAAAGTLLKLECEAGESEKIRGVGRVVWLRSEPNEHGPAGMGVKFVKLEPGSKELIGELVQQLAEAGIEARNISAPPETAAAARRAPEVATPVSSPGSIPSAAAHSSIPSATRSPATSALGASANRSPMPAIATARSPIPAVGRTPTPAASTPSNGAGALTPAAEPAASAKLMDARTASPQPQRAPDAPTESEASEQSAAAPSVASPGATAAADTGAGAQARPSGSESATATRLPSVISVPPPPARRGALRIWLGIVIGVAVLLAIIFSDDSTGSSPAPAATSGKPAPSDHAQLSAPPVPPPAAAEPSAADSRSTAPGSTSAAGDPPTAQVEPAEQPSTLPPATAAPQPTTPQPTTPQPTTPQTATPTAETPAATKGGFVMEFTSRPTGATVTVGDRNVVTPGRLEFGSDMPARVKVIAKKPGFQQSSAWIDHTGFENINGTLVRRVTMILPAEAAASPPATPAHPR
jgi:hypothetical protein